MHQLPIRSIALHAVAVIVVTMGLATAACVILLLTLQAQPADIVVGAAFRALWSYLLFIAAIAAALTLALLGAAAVHAIAARARRTAPRTWIAKGR